MEDWIDSVVRDVAEIPDRNSPDDNPDMMLVTGGELRAIILGRCVGKVAPPEVPAKIQLTYADGYAQAVEDHREPNEELRAFAESGAADSPAPSENCPDCDHKWWYHVSGEGCADTIAPGERCPCLNDPPHVQPNPESAPVEVTEARDSRQQQIEAWCIAAFGHAEATSLPQRGLRLLEEAAEAAQAVSVDLAMAHHLLDVVWSKPAGEIGQELGGVGVTTLALAAAAGLWADEEEAREATRVLSKPIEHFRKRNQAKNDAGLRASLPSPQPVEGAALEPCPCCGSEAKFMDDGDGGNFIECINRQCGLTTNLQYSLMEDCRPLLQEKWNRRTKKAGK
jgi:hypothetical protein